MQLPLCFALLRLAAALLSKALRLSSILAGLCQLGIPRCRLLSSFTALSQECWSHSDFFSSSFFLLVQSSYVEGFLPFLKVWSLLTAVSKCSVSIIPHVDFFFFDTFVGEGKPHVLLLQHLDPFRLAVLLVANASPVSCICTLLFSWLLVLISFFMWLISSLYYIFAFTSDFWVAVRVGLVLLCSFNFCSPEKFFISTILNDNIAL